jgi:hypothetical protein
MDVAVEASLGTYDGAGDGGREGERSDDEDETILEAGRALGSEIPRDGPAKRLPNQRSDAGADADAGNQEARVLSQRTTRKRR